MGDGPGLLRRVLHSCLQGSGGFAANDWFRSCRARAGASGKSEVLVLSPGRIPTTDIYLAPRLAGVAPAARIIDTLMLEPPGSGPLPGTDLVIVRHAPQAWLRWIRRHRDDFLRIALLMDDDMPQALLADELPFGYALRTARRHRAVRTLLSGCCDELWLSTAELLRRYPAPGSRRVEPLFLPAAGAPVGEGGSELLYFYHATRAHLRETRWLLPVVAAVQARVPEAVFEIFGDAGVAALFRDIPRVRVRPWLAWPEYLASSRSARYRVGLAPCLDTAFNRARSEVKLFDITRSGAAGVYADLAPYAGSIRQGETGFLCPALPEAWVEAIVALLTDPAMASSVAQAALLDCETRNASLASWPALATSGWG